VESWEGVGVGEVKEGEEVKEVEDGGEEGIEEEPKGRQDAGATKLGIGSRWL
jgi:hypothetical protein